MLHIGKDGALMLGLVKYYGACRNGYTGVLLSHRFAELSQLSCF